MGLALMALICVAARGGSGKWNHSNYLWYCPIVHFLESIIATNCCHNPTTTIIIPIHIYLQTNTAMAANVKSGAKILVIGHNKIGKSLLINKFIGQDKARVGDSVQPTKYGLIEEIEFTIDNKTMTIYDTRGFGDARTADRSIVEATITKMKQADVILICHKLYGSTDARVNRTDIELVRGLGNDLMKHAIFVFTFGDEYLIRYDESIDNSEAVKAHMETQEHKLKRHLKQILQGSGIKKEIVDDIPSIITSGKKVKLPTSENWVDELWGLCETRCKSDLAIGGLTKRGLTCIAMGATSGATSGAIAGSIIPGIGNVAGAAIGTIVGGALGAMGGWLQGQVQQRQK